MKPLGNYKHRLVLAAISIVAVLTLACCSRKPSSAETVADYSLPDTLRVATLYSPSSYFIYRDEPMGYDYSLVSQFASDKNLTLNLEVAPSLSRAFEMLDSGRVDLIAYEIPEILEYKSSIVPCGPRSETHQVLVQPKEKGKPVVTDVTDLLGHDIYVVDHSKYLYRLQNLNEELGGGIGINIIEADSLIDDDLVEMVADGRIPMTIVDNVVAKINTTYYPSVDVGLALSFPQTSAWGVAKGREWLGDSIDSWLDSDKLRSSTSRLHKRYFELSKVDANGVPFDISQRLSTYEALLRKYAAEIGWDWRLLAAICYKESRFNPNVESWAGARGLMQIMPRTAQNYGFDPDSLANPEISVQVAAKIFSDLNRMLSRRVHDENERLKFVLAAYNCGIGHVSDAVALARKFELNDSIWDGNVERALLMKSNPEFYNDSVVKNGYLRGRETIAYVHKVKEYYDRFRQELPE
ncbi:MAG: transglycosylase SLT domain-containing protein [Muribaculaceae bacterium]|nr:transglycosylase SLT domain-containing protein [Muribaculaceae bacterium]